MPKKKRASDFTPRAKLPHVQIQCPDGTLPFYYYRRRGFPLVPLPRPATLEYTLDENFMEAWRDLEIQAMAPTRKEQVERGTVDAMIQDYKSSPEWDDLSERTRRDYQSRGLDLLSVMWGKKKVARLRRDHGIALRNKYKSNPRKSKYVIQVASILWNWAINNKPIEYGSTNPFAGIKSVKQGEGYKPWTEEDVIRFLQSAPPARMRFALMIGLITGQRLGDAIEITWDSWDGAAFTLRQNKTGEEMWIPTTTSARRDIEAMPRRTTIGKGAKRAVRPHRTVLVNSHGQPWTASGFSHEFRKACDAAGLTELSFHGLRKLAVSRLIDAGCSKEEVKAITGHKTDAMVEHYDKAGNRKKRATAAVLKLEPKDGKK